MGQEERRGVLVHVVEIGPEFDVGDAPRDLELAPAMGGPAEHAQAIRNSELPMTISPLVPMSMWHLILLIMRMRRTPLLAQRAGSSFCPVRPCTDVARFEAIAEDLGTEGELDTTGHSGDDLNGHPGRRVTVAGRC